MKIYFDISTLNPDKVTGVGVYMLELMHFLNRDAKIVLHPVVKLSRMKKRKTLSHFLKQSVGLIYSPISILKSPNTVFHGPDFKLNQKGVNPQVVTIHDMVVFEKQYNAPAFYHRGIADMTKVLSSGYLNAVIVNSEFTKQQVLKFFPELSNKIFVTYLGGQRLPSPCLTTGEVVLKKPYIFYLGTLEKRKNILGLIKTFEILKERFNIPHQLVLAGGKGFEYEPIEEALANSRFKDSITHLSYVPDSRVASLYMAADLFFFPSHYEGFGIPVLEAMALGCPVVTSSHSAMSEICADAALYADSQDCEGFAEVIMKILNDSDLRGSLRQKGLERAKLFTWERCAQETLKVYQSLLKP